jgi:hypothetical protein
VWLAQAHARPDRAVWAAYGWDDPEQAAVEEDVTLARLLALNLERVGFLSDSIAEVTGQRKEMNPKRRTGRR